MSAIITSVMARLVAQGVGVEDVDLFAVPEVPQQIGIFPVNAVFMFTSDGFMPEGFFGSTPKDFRRVFVEIQVRREHNDFAGGDAKAEAIWVALQKAELTGIPGFTWCKSIRSAPTYIGQNKDKHRIWTLRFEVGFL